ncbi:MAG: hypothetical protein [Microviridae sp.]|nr:MAG: hypothetical protein [Microviridae sp.]
MNTHLERVVYAREIKRLTKAYGNLIAKKNPSELIETLDKDLKTLCTPKSQNSRNIAEKRFMSEQCEISERMNIRRNVAWKGLTKKQEKYGTNIKIEKQLRLWD